MTSLTALLTLRYLYVHACLPWNEQSLKAEINNYMSVYMATSEMLSLIFYLAQMY